MHFGQEYYRSDIISSQLHYIKGYMILKCLIPGETDIDHLVKVISARFLCCNVIFFLLIVCKISWGNILRPQISYLCSDFHPPVLSSIGESCLQNYYFFNFYFYLQFLWSFGIFWLQVIQRMLFFHFYFFISLGEQYIWSQRWLFKCKVFFIIKNQT